VENTSPSPEPLLEIRRVYQLRRHVTQQQASHSHSPIVTLNHASQNQPSAARRQVSVLPHVTSRLQLPIRSHANLEFRTTPTHFGGRPRSSKHTSVPACGTWSCTAYTIQMNDSQLHKPCITTQGTNQISRLLPTYYPDNSHNISL
jgi:hypothetical protein